MFSLGQLVYIRTQLLIASADRDADRMATAVFNKLMPKTTGLFSIVRVNEHASIIDENDINNTISM